MEYCAKFQDTELQGALPLRHYGDSPFLICSQWSAFNDLSEDNSPCFACNLENAEIINYSYSDSPGASAMHFSSGACAVGIATAVIASIVIFTVSDAVNAAGLVAAAAILSAGVVGAVWPLWRFRHLRSRPLGYEPLNQDPDNTV